MGERFFRHCDYFVALHTRLIVAEEIADGCRGLVSALGDLDGIETTFGEQFDVDAPRIHHFIVLTG